MAMIPAPIDWMTSLSPIFSSLVGALVGGTLTAVTGLIAMWILSKRLHRMRVLDHARRELRAPMVDYVDWLHALSGEFPLWRRELIPLYRPHLARDQHELNRLRRLFVDPRSSTWFARLDEYSILLDKFDTVVRTMWRQQADIGERFHRVLASIEEDPNAALKAAEELEEIAFEQAQLASEFMDHLQYECLKSVVGRKPRQADGKRKLRIERTSMGGIRLVQPVMKL